MSTRSVIARKTGEGRFRGVYHHWDGYPSGVGQTLFNMYHERFLGDVQSMLLFLIDRHPAGWSTINAEEPKAFGVPADPDEDLDFDPMTEKNAAGSGCEFAYVFDPERPDEMQVWSSYCKDGEKMVGAFGMGDPGGEWKCMAVVSLVAEPPDWEKLDNRAWDKVDATVEAMLDDPEIAGRIKRDMDAQS